MENISLTNPSAPGLEIKPVAPSVDVISTLDSFYALKSAWNRLLFASERPVPFLTWEWVSTWWTHFGRGSEMFILVAKEADGEVIGIAPLRVVIRKRFKFYPVRSLEFIGYRGSAVSCDHLDFIASEGRRRHVTQELAGKIFDLRDCWDVLEFGDLAEDSLVPEAIKSRSKGIGVVENGNRETCPYVRLAVDWNSFLKEVAQQHRSLVGRIKNYRKRLANQHRVRFVSTDRVEDVHESLDLIARLSTASQQRRANKRGNFALADYRAFHSEAAKAMAEAGFFYAASLECDAKPVSAVYAFHVRGILFFYQTGMDTAMARLNVGEILLGMVIEDSIERLHCHEFDFLRGNEEYKYRWTERQHETSTVWYWPPSMPGKVSEVESMVRKQLAYGKCWLKRLFGRSLL